MNKPRATLAGGCDLPVEQKLVKAGPCADRQAPQIRRDPEGLGKHAPVCAQNGGDDVVVIRLPTRDLFHVRSNYRGCGSHQSRTLHYVVQAQAAGRGTHTPFPCANRLRSSACLFITSDGRNA